MFPLQHGTGLFEDVGASSVAQIDYFTIAGVEQSETEIHIKLDERMNQKLSGDANFESKGFMEAVSVTDFPIRDHKVILHIRRQS